MSEPDPTLLRRLSDIRDRVAAAATAAGRDPADVQILLATKTQPPALIAAAVRAGFGLIGENRAQEVTGKADELAALLAGVPFRRHFIGRLQSNKINQVVPLVDCVESVDSADLAAKLARRAAADRRRLDVLAQVNVSGEDSKAGVAPEQVFDLVEAIAAHDALHLRGLMTVGLNSPDRDAVAAGYRLLASLRDEICALSGGSRATPGVLPVLSMGMSDDLELAVAAGATEVRLGSAAFGPRPAP
ncbi:YggS family pyridoxal phosphate-dependent enzyme [Nakamurella deserti]|uniref:YggS family pyridoxal phosphate-dependent enzyme n=1 Tax=Nakamurella deserti TaxID=2164074 RepID=UPI0014787C3F|nr:YggS family pyridoxal phosphate-dependent enzyme [Nakamurella deserti]